MSIYEYKVVPAPKKGLKGKGVKGNQARFANALQSVMNDLGAEGWEYQRTDTLPFEERQGLTGRSTSFQNMLVFRRSVVEQIEDDTAEDAPALIEDQSDEPVSTVEERTEETLLEEEVPTFRTSAEPAEAPTPEEPRHAAE